MIRSKKSSSQKVFPLLEISAVILIIGIFVAGVMGGNILVAKSRLAAAQTLTTSSPINGIKDSALWLETSVDSSFVDGETANNNSITTWYDSRKSAANKVVISAAGTGPLYSNTINYIHAVKFSGSSSDHLKIEDASFLNNTDYTIIILEKRQSNSANNYFFGESPTGTANQKLALGYSLDGTVIHAQGTNSYTSNVSSYANSTDKPKVFTFISDSSSGKKTYINGVLAAQSADTTQLTGITTDFPIGKSYTGEIGEIAIFTRALKAEERKSVEDYIGKKFTAKINRDSVASCTNGTITPSGCSMDCSTSLRAGISAPSSITDGATVSATCGLTGYNGTTVSLTCLGENISGTACGCAVGYNPVGGACVQQCSVSVSGSNVTSVGSGVTQVACNAGGNYSTTPFTFLACSGSAISGSCACITGYAGVGCSGCDLANDYNIPSGDTVCRHKCTINGVTGITNGTKVDYAATSKPFTCNSGAYNGSTINYTCDGTTFNVVGPGCSTAPSYLVLSSGTSYTVPAGYTQAKIWAVGAGGGGGGSPANNNNTAGGGGGAGGVAYKTWTVSGGETITYSIGNVGAGGVGAAAGFAGGNTTVTLSGVTITGNGGGAGSYNNNSGTAAGGSFSGGDGGATGGTGSGRNGDIGGGSGGGIGGVSGLGGTPNVQAGGAGVNSADVSSLHVAVTGAGQVIVSGGVAADGAGPTDGKNGGNATGFGCSGGGAGAWGGNGGAGRFGGGVAGAAGLGSAVKSGGAGGSGAVVIKFF